MNPQAVEAPLAQSATFLVLSATDVPDALKNIRSAVSSISDITKNISTRHPSANLSCTIGIGSKIWDGLTQLPRPRELRPFNEIRGAKHTAVSTPGKLLFHIRSERRDMSFEFERQLMDLLGDAVKTEDETVGFRYFDARDVLGLSTEKQEAIIGRTKLDNIELDDAEDGRQQSHKSLATIEDEDGNEHVILRDNMPFGSPASGELGTYFIGYSKKLWVTEKMLERMGPLGLRDLIYSLNMVTMAIAKFLPVAVLASLVAGQTLIIPARSGSIISLPAPSVISGSKDMGNKECDRGRACETDVETPGGHPVFILDDGATLSNAIIGIG
ncbi:putative deferrochelatase/peroxidase YfeX [Colletotrichum sp. SAR11_59]|nr:putative deferrochelatase/peroxidase YfeX [Colletotrichum sp. SAR11_59]